MENTVRLKLSGTHINTIESTWKSIGGQAYPLAGINEAALLLKKTSYAIRRHRSAYRNTRGCRRGRWPPRLIILEFPCQVK
jgi:hypothetical protein